MAGKITKAELIDALQSTRKLSHREIHIFIDALLEELKGAILAGKTVELRGFGTFEVDAQGAKKGSQSENR